MRKEWILLSLAPITLLLMFPISGPPDKSNLHTNQTGNSSERTADEDALNRKQIQTVYEGMMERWNAHDIYGFFSFAWNSPDLVDVDDGITVKGWANDVAVYLKAWPRPEMMGRAECTVNHISLLKPNLAVASISVKIYQPNGHSYTSRGIQKFEKIAGTWKITSSRDNSSLTPLNP
jgi:hypothetical protein